MNRVGFIGGSDATRIMTGNWYDLWAEKTSRKEPDDLSNNLAVQLGTHTESFHIDLFSKQSNINNQKIRKQVTYDCIENGVPYKGTVDARIEDAILECKHTNAFTNMKEQLARYMPQLQFYIHISGVRERYSSSIFGNRTWDDSKVSCD